MKKILVVFFIALLFSSFFLVDLSNGNSIEVNAFSNMPPDSIKYFPDVWTFTNDLGGFGISRYNWDNDWGVWDGPYPSTQGMTTPSGITNINGLTAPFGNQIIVNGTKLVFSNPIYAFGATFITTNFPNFDFLCTSFDNNQPNTSYNVIGYDINGNIIKSVWSSSYDYIAGPREIFITCPEFIASFAGIWSSVPIHEVTILGLNQINNRYLGNFSFLAFSETPYSEPVPSLGCVGFDPPMDKGSVKVEKHRVLPLKANLFHTDGSLVIDSDLIAPPVVQVSSAGDSTVNATKVTGDALTTGMGTSGNQFVFTTEGIWQFNFSTKNYTAPGTYTLTIQSGNPSEYVISPQCQGTFVIE